MTVAYRLSDGTSWSGTPRGLGNDAATGVAAAVQTVEEIIRSGSVSIIVVDSVAALLPQSEILREAGDPQIGSQARLMSNHLRRIAANANKHNVAVLFINQLRMKVGVVFGNPEVPPHLPRPCACMVATNAVLLDHVPLGHLLLCARVMHLRHPQCRYLHCGVSTAAACMHASMRFRVQRHEWREATARLRIESSTHACRLHPAAWRCCTMRASASTYGARR